MNVQPSYWHQYEKHLYLFTYQRVSVYNQHSFMFEGVLSCCFGLLITDRENVGGLRWVLRAVMLQETTDDG